MNNPLFPTLLVRSMVATDHEYNLEKKLSIIKVRNAGLPAVNGEYIRRGTYIFVKSLYLLAQEQVHHPLELTMEYFISRSNPGSHSEEELSKWILFRRPAAALRNDDSNVVVVQEILYSCNAHPLSILPPRGGWQPHGRYASSTHPPILKFE